MNTKILINRFNLSDKSLVAKKWQLLERNSTKNIFLSWQWISNWLDLVTDNLFLIEANHNNKVVGLGFFVEKERKVLGVFSIKQWWLHRTGVQQQDQIWVEYNDFLLDKSCSATIRTKMIEAVSTFDSSVKEVIIGLSGSEQLNCFDKSFTRLNFLKTSIIKDSGYLVPLSCTKDDYLNKVLSKNTRNQISRSKKILQSYGKLSFEVFSTPQKLIELYPKIANIHIDKWKDTNEGSGFLNPLFEKFHKSMAMNSLDSTVQIAVLSLDEVELGYLINFVYNNKVYFYLSALKKNSDNKVKIGLTLHCEAIQYYLDQGVASYDFLCGDARYKKSLSNEKYKLEMKCYYRDSLLLHLERNLKNFKTKTLAILSKYFN